MSERFDAICRDISRRLRMCSEDEASVIDLILLDLERSRGARNEPPLLDTGSQYNDLENAYRRGHNDAMRSESPQVSLWRARVLLATRASDVERGLAELRGNAQSDEEQAAKVPSTEEMEAYIDRVLDESLDRLGAELQKLDEERLRSGVVQFDLSEVE